MKGFKNHGNTCYLNCATLILIHTPEFIDYIRQFRNISPLCNKLVQLADTSDSPSSDQLYAQYIQELTELKSNFDFFQQHDPVADIWRQIIFPELRRVDQQKTNPFSNTTMVRSMCCRQVETESSDICFLTPNEYHQMIFHSDGSTGYKEFPIPCSICKEKPSEMQRSITSVGSILFIHVNIITASGKPNYLEQLATAIVLQGFVYRLYAIIVHHGSPQFGHYTCQIEKENIIYQVNDSSVQKVKRFKTNYASNDGHPMMLCYRRVETNKSLEKEKRMEELSNQVKKLESIVEEKTNETKELEQKNQQLMAEGLKGRGEVGGNSTMIATNDQILRDLQNLLERVGRMGNGLQ